MDNNIKTIIYIDEENCVGCNKCILNCPVQNANIAYLKNGENKVKVCPSQCIHCGQCVKVCDHNARKFIDDTNAFFQSNKKNLSLLIAPSFRHHFPNYKQLFGFFKSLGANNIYDVSFGADITTWCYAKYISENNVKHTIAQPCPPIVNYIEKYKPELIDYLAPLHSPAVSLAIYLKKYLNIQDELAFISPCIGKYDEFNDPNTEGHISSNVTFKNIKEYLDANNIDLSKYDESDYNLFENGIGFTFSRPGGLGENFQLYSDEKWIKEISGQNLAYKYLDTFYERLKQGLIVPDLIDILNCQDGCNMGTGTCMNLFQDDIDHVTTKLKKENISKNILEEKYKLKEFFDKELKLDDFYRKYNNKFNILSHCIEPSEDQYENVFNELHKNNERTRSINCYACGYGDCKKLAKAILNGQNLLGNCIFYNKKELELESIKDDFISIVSHELRTPLTSIRGAISLILNNKNNAQSNPEQCLQLIELANSNCERLTMLLNDILDLQKIAAGKMEFIYVCNNVSALLTETISLNQTFAAEYNVNLIMKETHPSLHIYVDRDRTIQVLTNLISNAVKFSKPHDTVELIAKRFNNLVRFEVKDFGIGISDSFKKVIFEKFTQASDINTRKKGGSGLGLSICKAIIEKQNGQIWFESEEGEGTSFFIDLPECHR